MVRTRVRCAAAAAAVACCTQPAAAVTQYGTVVYSATPAGVAAAVAAAANGAHRVALVEPLANIGGMGAAGGLGLHDQQMANLTMVTGLARDWAERNARYYPGSDSELVHHPDMYVAEASFREMVADAKSVELLAGCRLESVRRDAARLRAIAAITVLCSEESEGGGGRRVELAASLFVDASYDAEVVVGAGGVDTAWGRESRNTYGEPLAGAQYTQYGIESFDALGGAVSGTRPDGTVLRYVERGAPPPEGTADDALMAFQHRACVTPDANNSVPFPAPPGYDPAHFALLQQQLDAAVATGLYPQGPPLDWFLDLGRYADAVFAAGRRKFVVCCGAAPVNSDQPGLNKLWAVADHSQRQAMVADHRYYLQGSLYYMANEPAVPNATRASVSAYGLCADEWPDNGHWPPQLYVRSSVRLVGDYVMTQNNLAAPRSKPDAVVCACWELDQHLTTRHALMYPPSGPAIHGAFNEGFFRHAIDPAVPPSDTKSGMRPFELWYDIPYRAMLPKREQASNLLVPVALSASSVAMSSARIETAYMGTGAAAGVAARQVMLAAEGGAALDVQDVNVTKVQEALRDEYRQRTHGPFW